MAEQPIIIPNLNPTGKQQLMAEAGRIKRHRELVSNEQMQQSLNLALLEYQRDLSIETMNSNDAAANMFKLKGAQEFIIRFMYLSEAVPPKKLLKPELAKLDHNA